MATPTEPVLLDRAEGLRRVAGDVHLYADLVQIFVRDLPRMLGLIDAALVKADAAALQCAAHALKGSASQVGARAVAEHAAALETAARAGTLVHAQALRPQLEQTLARLRAVLDANPIDAGSDS